MTIAPSVLLACAVQPLLAAIALAEPPPLPIAVSLPPQVWLVESIGGPHVTVAALVGPGDSEETYAPTDAQVSAALRAKVFFRAGAAFEQAPWFRALMTGGEVEVVDTRAGVERTALDPHVWTSPRRLSIQARTVAATLGRIDPANQRFYDGGRDDVVRELEVLDRDLAETLAPYRGRAFFVFHPTWGYFASDYGLRQIAVEVEGKEPSDRDLTRLSELARAERPRSLFVDQQVSQRAAEAVAAAIGASVVRLDPLAPDVAVNLRRVALRLAESWSLGVRGRGGFAP